MNDGALIRRYACDKDDRTFDELVRKHYSMVRRAAFAKTGDAQTAEDVATSVFLLLAERAHTFKPDVVLVGWLFKAACLTACNAVRMDKRRRKCEAEAIAMAEEAARCSESQSDIGLLSRRRADSLAIRVAARNNHRHPVRPRRA